MIPARTIASLRNAPSVENFFSAPPRIVGVGGASATVRGYIDAPLVIAGTRVQHPLIVVEELAYPHLIRMDILGPHDAQLGVGGATSIRLAVERFTVCDEMRAGLPRITYPTRLRTSRRKSRSLPALLHVSLCASHHRSSACPSSSQSRSRCRFQAPPAPPSPLST